MCLHQPTTFPVYLTTCFVRDSFQVPPHDLIKIPQSIPGWRLLLIRLFKEIFGFQNLCESKWLFSKLFFAFQICWRRKVAQTREWFKFFSHSIDGDKLPPFFFASIEYFKSWRAMRTMTTHDSMFLPAPCDDSQIFYSLALLWRWCHELISENSPVCKISLEFAWWFYS